MQCVPWNSRYEYPKIKTNSVAATQLGRLYLHNRKLKQTGGDQMTVKNAVGKVDDAAPAKAA